MASVVCPHCRRKVGTVERSEGEIAVSAWCEDPPDWPNASRDKRRRVSPRVSSQTLLLRGLPGEHTITFNCSKHGVFVTTVAGLRKRMSRS
jgi:hypothetical protein